MPEGTVKSNREIVFEAASAALGIPANQLTDDTEVGYAGEMIAARIAIKTNNVVTGRRTTRLRDFVAQLDRR